jgi:Transposase domain (DUF772)
MLLGILLYAYATGVRSSRQIQRRCTEDLAFRVLAGNQLPDHVTIARFRVRHQQALAGVLVESLRLCAAAGLVRLGLVALDGTKVAANAADKASRPQERLEAEVANGRTGKPRKDGKPSASRSDGLRAAMLAKLRSEQGKACYTKRKQTVEAAVRHPQPAQALAPQPPPAGTRGDHQLNRGGRRRSPRAPIPMTLQR